MAALFKTTLMTPQQVADYLGVSTETLNVWRCTKRYNQPAQGWSGLHKGWNALCSMGAGRATSRL